MGVEAVSAPASPAMQEFRSPRTVVARFVGRGVYKSAAAVGFYLGVSVASTAIGFVRTYKDAEGLVQLIATYGSNAGINALVGTARSLDTVNGMTVMKILMVSIIAAAVWGIVVSTKRFRGEEQAGRLELLLSGQAGAGEVAANTLAGLGLGVLVMYVLMAVITAGVGHRQDIGFSVSSSLFFALTAAAAAAEFAAVGALASQLAPTRRRAAGMASLFLAACYVLRGIGDGVTSVHWMTDISPLGWIENLRPLTGSQPLWLLPIIGFTAVLCGLTLYLAGRRDLGASVLPDKDTAPPRTRLLRSPLGLTIRETRYPVIAWLAGIAVVGVVYGSLAKSAGDVVNASSSLADFIKDLARVQFAGINSYLGLIFMFVMAMLMWMAASFAGAVRDEEEEGFLENLLVRPVSRLQWLGGRTLVIAASVTLAGLVTGLFTWFGIATQDTGIGAGRMMGAGVNAIAPALFIAGVGILVFGIKPRWTSIVLYVIIAWSFLLQLVGPSLKLSHWIMDTSVLYHVAMAPASDPDWLSWAVVVGIGAACAALGAFLFNRRDLLNP